MFPTTYYIKTFGCQMNHSDSERIAGFLEMQKAKPARDINDTDLIILNTCGVRQMAEDRIYGQIHNIRKQESENSNQGRKIIILTGCLADRKDVRKRLKNKVDLFCGIKNFPTEIKKVLDTKYKIQNTTKLDFDYLKILPRHVTTHTALVPIMTGCNNFCSYCVVPYARGPEISRPAEEIIKEIKNLIKRGCKEIILLGQNVNSYRFIDKNSSAQKADRKSAVINFSTLLKKINDIPGEFWIWFVSSHPKDFSDELIETMAKCRKVCECVHLPLQAGDDKVLRNMNRKYTAKSYMKIIRKIRAAFRKYTPGELYSITSDIIVGFPGETKKQFMESAKIMRKVGYDMVYFGQFSPRPGTTAWKMKDNVTKKEKVRRERHLNEILKKTALNNNQKYLGKTLEVLIDKEKNDAYFGHTRTYKNVKISAFGGETARKNLADRIVKVKIMKANIWNLEGEII